MNRAWIRRRTKQGYAARQFKACERKLRRLRAQNVPLPHTVTSRGVGLTLTITLDNRPRPEAEYDLDEMW